MSHPMPAFSAARAMERTYQALDSSAVATTTASFGGLPAAVSAAAREAVSVRIEAASSLPERTAAASAALIWRSACVRPR